MIHGATRQPMPGVRVILISLPGTWRDEFNEDYPLPKAIEYATFTNAQGEFWFCGLATRNDITWGVTPSHESAYVYPTVIYYFEKRKDLGGDYENFFEMTPF